MSAEDIANAFVNHFYTTLDNNPSALAGLYQPQSTLTFEGTKFEGPQKIMEKYMSIGKVDHNIPMLTKDIQLSVSNSAMLIFVTGRLKIGGGNELLFSHVFQLVANGPGSYYVHNEMFRLIYA